MKSEGVPEVGNDCLAHSGQSGKASPALWCQQDTGAQLSWCHHGGTQPSQELLPEAALLGVGFWWPWDHGEQVRGAQVYPNRDPLGTLLSEHPNKKLNSSVPPKLPFPAGIPPEQLNPSCSMKWSCAPAGSTV